MKMLATAALAAILSGEAIVAGAADIVPRDGGSTIRVWSGPCVITIGGNDYLPLGDRAFAQQNSNAMGTIAQGMTLTVSGIEAEAVLLLDADEVKSAAVTVYRLIFANDGKTLLDAHVYDRGRGDAINVRRTVGGLAAIEYSVESAARSLGRSGARSRSDSDQRLIDPSDDYFKNTAYAGRSRSIGAARNHLARRAAVSSPPNPEASVSSASRLRWRSTAILQGFPMQTSAFTR
jgi:hypothetical protein